MRRLLLASLVAAAACRGADPSLARTVREYDDAVIAAYATSDLTALERVATREEAGRVRVLVDIKTSARLVLESRLESFEVVRADAAGETATVETRERWSYRDRRLDPGQPAGPQVASDMRMRYALVKEGAAWKVGSVATLANEYLAPRR